MLRQPHCLVVVWRDDQCVVRIVIARTKNEEDSDDHIF